MVAKIVLLALFTGVVLCPATVVMAAPGAPAVGRSSQPWRVYAGDASWDEEVVFLYQLSRYLMKHPDAVGHIVYFSSKKVSRRKLERRLVRSVRYLTQHGKVSRKRLKVYYGGHEEAAKVVLQPVDKGTEPSGVPK